MSTSATNPKPRELVRLEVANDLSRATMVATIAATDAITSDDIHALLEASTIGCGADYATIIAELDAKPRPRAEQRP
jgi:hypothetical protein